MNEKPPDCRPCYYDVTWCRVVCGLCLATWVVRRYLTITRIVCATAPHQDKLTHMLLFIMGHLTPRRASAPGPKPKGLFTALELNWTDLQQVNPVTFITRLGITPWLAAAKLGRLVLSQFWTQCIPMWRPLTAEHTNFTSRRLEFS